MGLQAPGMGGKDARRPAVAWAAAMTLRGVHAVRPMRPDGRHTLTSSDAACGWTADRYEQWVGDTLLAQLLAHTDRTVEQAAP
jgi:hypothetical protein